MYKRLFIPGPVDVKPEVLARMAGPMIGHRTKDASALQKSISDKLRQLMYTKNEILLSTSSGSGLMEGAIRSCTAKRAAVFSIGAFGDRWFRMAESNGVPADKISFELGTCPGAEDVEKVLATGKYDLITITHNETATGVATPLEPIAEVLKRYPEVVFCVDSVSSLGGHKIEVDKLGIDICISSSQKCLGLPPGLSLCSVSEKAVRNAEKVEHRGLYFDFVELYKFVKEKNQYPSTPSLSHMFALDYQLDRILAEGLDNRFARHLEMAERVRSWASEHFSLFAAEGCRSNTVTCINNGADFDFSSVNSALGERGFSISNGYGKTKGSTFRIAHMADATLADINELLAAIEEVLGFSKN